MATSKIIAIAAGGTAGHINPALALATELRSRGYQVVFFGEPDRLEATLVPEAGFEFVPVETKGFDRSRPWTLIQALVVMGQAQSTIKHYCQDNHLDIAAAVGFGAYVELPLLRCCLKEHIPCAIHEQNSVPGLANKYLSGKVDRVCVSFPAAKAAFQSRVKDPAVLQVTGNPVRQKVLEVSRDEARKSLDIPEDAQMVLVFGGSLGAQRINQAMVEAAHELLQRPQVYIIHAAGPRDFDQIEAEAEKLRLDRERYRLYPYIKDMAEALNSADLVVSRAGASSVAEIAACGLPSVLIPDPFATADHQTTNARWLEDAGAALIVPDEQVDHDSMVKLVSQMLNDTEKLQTMAGNAQAMEQGQAAKLLADQVESMV